jgi:hypothetical protein
VAKKFNFKEWFNRVILGKQPEVVEPVEYVGPDELAEKLAAEAEELFAAMQAKRVQAAETLEQAAEAARTQAEQLRQRAEQVAAQAAERAAKALRNREVAGKLQDFLG